ncbi:type VI secretion system ATPase TssH [Rubrivirga sp.]|uniref:type VI secretion system ATPase TssH n=1 Tax=Rubrivirga sp. TaxID=1885344 RepID=UPI003B521138
MDAHDVRSLLQKLNEPTAVALQAAAGLCIDRGHYEVGPAHLLLALLDRPSDVAAAVRNDTADDGAARAALIEVLDGYRTGNTGRPTFSPLLLDVIQQAWMTATVHHGASEVRSAHVLEAALADGRLGVSEAFAPLRAADLRDDFDRLTQGSAEGAPASSAPAAPVASGGGGGPLDEFTTDVTARARAGEIDPVFGRDREIRQITDVLLRRRKNNAMLVGEAGVGKTAVVEGLALRMAEGDVPDALRDTDLRALDLARLQAGASVKGAFEDRLKRVLAALKEAPRPTLLFIDEAHTLIGAGGAAGTGDAANLLKPALARGELRTVAATTWAEYKKHIEKDPALERRFQPIFVDEPTAQNAAVMLRGLKSRYEAHHGVAITAEAVDAMAELSDRYITGRQLPDKAVDLMDTAAARVRLSQTGLPDALDDAERQLRDLAIEAKGVRADLAAGLRHDAEAMDALDAQRDALEADRETLRDRWRHERDLALRLAEARRRISGRADEEADAALDVAEGGDDTPAEEAPPSEAPEAPADDALIPPPPSFDDLPTDEAELRAEIVRLSEALAEVQGEAPLVYPEVTPAVVARVVSDWTGVPAGSVVRDEATALLGLEERLGAHVRGQAEAVAEVAETLRAAKAGLGDPDAPLGVFLFVGPSGVGKTELARTLAGELFGGDRFLTTINLSEYQEAHTVSQLKGSPPGYVGYGEGGVLTEAVRQRPYSVVLLDEAEKAHADALDLFYQVFDKGTMRDGEGREIDFKNTVLCLTSNLGAGPLLKALEDQPERPPIESLREGLRPILSKHFQAALLARMRIVPFYPLSPEALAEVARMRLQRVADRLAQVHGVAFTVSDAAVRQIVERGTRSDTGARALDAVVQRTVLPEAARLLLAALADGDPPAALRLDVDADGELHVAVDDGSAERDDEPVADVSDVPGDADVPDVGQEESPALTADVAPGTEDEARVDSDDGT